MRIILCILVGWGLTTCHPGAAPAPPPKVVEAADAVGPVSCTPPPYALLEDWMVRFMEELSPSTKHAQEFEWRVHKELRDARRARGKSAKRRERIEAAAIVGLTVDDVDQIPWAQLAKEIKSRIETPEERHDRYVATAWTAATLAFDETQRPLPSPGRTVPASQKRLFTVALLLAFGWGESDFHPHIDKGHWGGDRIIQAKRRWGTQAQFRNQFRAWCSAQILFRHPRYKTRDGWGRDEVALDRTKCWTTGKSMLAWAYGTARPLRLPYPERFGAYVAGNPHSVIGRKRSRRRTRRALALWHQLPPPGSDSDFQQKQCPGVPSH